MSVGYLNEFERKQWLLRDPWGAVTRVVYLERVIKEAICLLGDPYYQEKLLREALSNNVSAQDRTTLGDGDPGHQ